MTAGARCGVLALGIAIAAGGATRAEILRADLRVDGMACPFCAFGIEKKLLAVDGVAEVEVLLDEGRLLLRLEPGNEATPAAFGAAVAEAGFEAGELAIEARGSLDAAGEDTWLEVHPGLRIPLVERDGGGGERPLSPARREQLIAADPGSLLVSGTLMGSAAAPRLLVDSEPTPDAGGP